LQERNRNPKNDSIRNCEQISAFKVRGQKFLRTIQVYSELIKSGIENLRWGYSADRKKIKKRSNILKNSKKIWKKNILNYLM